MPDALLTFFQTWHIGRRVQEASPPQRKGTIRTVNGTGGNAVITVNLDGHPPASFRPSQLIPI